MIDSVDRERFVSKEGHEVRVRPIDAADTALLVDIFEHMSSDSRYKRYNQTLDSVAPSRVWQEAIQIAFADTDKNQGLIAFTDLPDELGIPVGAARLVETAPGEAEVAISLRDDFQNMGIGRQLMRLLALDARDAGYKTLTASIRNDNPAIWSVFKSLPFEVVRLVDGSFSDVVVRLDRPAGNSQ